MRPGKNIRDFKKWRSVSRIWLQDSLPKSGEEFPSGVKTGRWPDLGIGEVCGKKGKGSSCGRFQNRQTLKLVKRSGDDQMRALQFLQILAPALQISPASNSVS
jgi:hypothetical protein